MIAQNAQLRAQLEESHRTNESLTNDLQKLTNDWESLRDEMLSKEDEWKMEEEVKENHFLMHSFASSFDRTNFFEAQIKVFDDSALKLHIEVDQDRRELIAEIIRNKKFGWVRNCQAKVRLESQSSFPDVEPKRESTLRLGVLRISEQTCEVCSGVVLFGRK